MPEGRDPLRYFRLEARELVDQISAGVLDLDQQSGPEVVSRLLRAAHTLKGAARVVKQQDIAERAHALEEVLIPHRGTAEPPAAREMRELLRLNDEIAAYVSALEHPVAAPAGPDQPETAAEAAEAAAPRAVTADLDELLDAIGQANTRIAPLREGARTMDRLHRASLTLADHLHAGPARAPQEAAQAEAQRLCGELGALGRRLTDAIDLIERELDEIRGRAEGLRLVGAGTIFTALRRAVRDAAEAEGRRVRFTGRGAEVRMGPHLLTQISGAFQHVVRNAVVHGVEPPEDRLAAGKPAEGTVTVEVERRARHAIVRCHDDGRGFDLVALRRVAADRGLLGPGDPEPEPQTLIDLVLRGGVSTSPRVTDVAGRGIGMDVARDVAARLGGRVAIRTRPGAGTTVEMVVPLTLLSMNGLVVSAGATVATIPLDAVRHCVRLSRADATAAVSTGRLAHEGRVVPYLPLTRAMRLDPEPDREAGPAVAVVVTAGDAVVAVGVDRLAGTGTLVARPLPDLAPAAPVIGSVAIGLDGEPRLVLDPHGLVAEARRGHVDHGRPAPAEPARPILVVDDSLTTRTLERSILESAGYRVDLAASGEEALAKARSVDYGLFLTDIDMPGMDGFAFIAETRADPALARVPVILVSSRDGARDRRRGAEAGAGAYVVKGEFDQGELLGHVRRLIRS